MARPFKLDQGDSAFKTGEKKTEWQEPHPQSSKYFPKISGVGLMLRNQENVESPPKEQRNRTESSVPPPRHRGGREVLIIML